LQLFVQLDLDALPAELDGMFGSGVLQLFYCTGQDYSVPWDGKPECVQDDAWEPFSNSASLVRVVPTGAVNPPVSSTGTGKLPASAIVGWERFDDYPDPQDHDLAGLTVIYDFKARTAWFRCGSVDLDATLSIDELEVEDIARAAERDKLDGWPYWVQNQEYPTCPDCGTLMRLVFQLDSEDHVPFMFGDAGVGHITQCPIHHDVVAFGWACS
jgi:hypothetical protein